MSQEKIKDFLKHKKDLWFNQAMLKAHFYIIERRKPEEWRTLEIEISRALLNLNWDENIERKVFGVTMFYKYTDK